MSKKSKRPARTGSHGSGSSSDFNPDYSNIKKDLKQISLLAGMFVAILIVLSFFL